MPNISKKTEVVTVRLPVEVIKKIKERVAQHPGYWTVSAYIRKRIVYDVERKHIKRRGKR